VTQLKRERKRTGDMTREKGEIEGETDKGTQVHIFTVLLSHIDSDRIFKTFWKTVVIVHGREL